MELQPLQKEQELQVSRDLPARRRLILQWHPVQPVPALVRRPMSFTLSTQSSWMTDLISDSVTS